jgi:hypothetical protein
VWLAIAQKRAEGARHVACCAISIEDAMNMNGRCETCGNEYDKAFQVIVAGRSHTFDSFECAIDKLAPRCARCEQRIIGHGVEKEGRMFCCAHCASASGVRELVDRA